ncbi:hypothetical protein [Acidimangrovimonas pyrenivorans]|uniref:Uncharacterized protein n=1 Tax=Acidimangrovimonas pyrenivorans TaxID=2030798 RepID=A0ABV7AN43_9RHOB
MELAELDRKLLAAHAEGDAAALVALYTRAGDAREAVGDIPAACFYLTQAFVFALEAGLAEAEALNRRLFDHGRAHLLRF